MAQAPMWRRYLCFWGPNLPADVDTELQFHLEMLAEKYLAEGMAPADARAQARCRFGDVNRVRTECLKVDQRWETQKRRRDMLDALWQDVRFGARTLARNPGFTLVALLTLALGIGGNTAIFSVFNSVILRPLPYPEPDRLVQVVERNPDPGFAVTAAAYVDMAVSAHNYVDYREHNTVFEEMGWVMGGPYNILGGGDQAEPISVTSVSVSPSIFEVLELRPALGSVWGEDEEQYAYGPRVALLGHELWEGRFGSDPDIVGQTVTLDAWPHVVVGVMPPGAGIPPLSIRDEASHAFENPEVYVPIGYDAYGQLSSRRARPFRVIARLRRGVTPEQAQAEMTALAAGLEEAYPDELQGWTAGVIPLQAMLLRSVGPRIGLLMAAVGLVLLIACANVANLLLAQGTARRQEMAIRVAVGGGRLRLIRQLLTESLVLAGAAGLAGLLFAYWGNQFLVSLIPAGVPRALETGIDGRVLAFTALLTLGTALVFGLVPAYRASHVDVTGAIKGTLTRSSASPGRRRVTDGLVVGQVALALMLLVGAGLLVRNFLRVTGADLGFEPENVLTVRLSGGRPNLYNSTYFGGCNELGERCRPKPGVAESLFQRMVDRVRRVPGVRSASVVDWSPLTPSGGNSLGPDIFVQRVAGSSPDASPPAGSGDACVSAGFTSTWRVVQPGYFGTMGISILSGRDFAAGDPESKGGFPAGVATVAVTQSVAQRLWPDEDPLGKRMGIGERCNWTVVAVTEDTRNYTLDDRAQYGERLDRVTYVKGFGGGLTE